MQVSQHSNMKGYQKCEQMIVGYIAVNPVETTERKSKLVSSRISKLWGTMSEASLRILGISLSLCTLRIHNDIMVSNQTG